MVIEAEVFENRDVTHLDRLLLDEQGLVRVLPASKLRELDTMDVRIWCHKRAVYGLPSEELVSFLRDRIAGRTAIEIGAGHGALGRALKIPVTDNRMQERPDIRLHYLLTGQPTIAYPRDVVGIDALEAVKKYRPQVVIASWVTQLYDPRDHARGGNAWGVDEGALLKSGIEQYYFVGATSTHAVKPILQLPHEELSPDWLFGRGAPSDRRIWVWTVSTTTP